MGKIESQLKNRAELIDEETSSQRKKIQGIWVGKRVQQRGLIDLTPFTDLRASLLEDFREFDHARLDLEESRGSYEQSLLKERAPLHRNTDQVNRIFSTIKKKRAMDTIILSLLASVCPFLLLIYWLIK